jgi:uncharacterized ferredoxin-like protein
MAETAVEMVAELMALSARTAPKGRGIDSIVTRIVAGDDLKTLSKEMHRLGEQLGLKFLLRDGKNVEDSDLCLLIGARGRDVAGLDCGGCGYATCQEMLTTQERVSCQNKPFFGPNCVVKMADLGIALGSAAKTASLHNVDNRIMFTVGAGARSLGWLEGCNVIYGIPLKASGKSIYFDRSQ